MHVDPKLTNYWIRNSQIPPCVIAQLHPTTTPALCNAQGQVSARCKATTICRRRASHLSWIFVGCCTSHGYLQRVHWSTVSTPKYPGPGPRPLISCAVPCWTPEIETYLQKQEFIQNHFWHKRATKTT